MRIKLKCMSGNGRLGDHEVEYRSSESSAQFFEPKMQCKFKISFVYVPLLTFLQFTSYQFFL